ncbi:MAG: phosphoribosylanthranilate isomerase [Lutibacter sp.]
MQIKICCISSFEEANLAIKLGATAIGLVGKMPSGPGVISDELIAKIAAEKSKIVDTFLLTSETEVLKIIDHYKKVNTTTIQLVDELKNGSYAELKKQLPNVKIVQVIHVLDHSSLIEAKKIAPFVDALLLDSGNPNLKIKKLGGTGKTHNWDVSRKIVESVSVPVYLAGGISATNVKEAINHVQPYGLDLCSSVRTNGKLDKYKLQQFFNTVNN